MRVVLLTEAEQEAEAAAVWYESRSPGLGYDFLTQFRESILKIAENPLLMQSVKVSGVEVDLRRCLLKRFPYQLIYLCAPDRIVVLATAHHKRKPGYWRERAKSAI